MPDTKIIGGAHTIDYLDQVEVKVPSSDMRQIINKIYGSQN